MQKIKPRCDDLSSTEENSRTPAGDAYTNLIHEILRIHGRILAAGDRLTNDLRLTSARWQVLGAIHSGGSATVAKIARNMGLQRQSVQRVVDLLVEEGLIELVTNPDHARAKLAQLTAAGRNKLRKVDQRQVGWADRIARDMSPKAIAAAASILRQLRERLEIDERG